MDDEEPPDATGTVGFALNFDFTWMDAGYFNPPVGGNVAPTPSPGLHTDVTADITPDLAWAPELDGQLQAPVSNTFLSYSNPLQLANTSSPDLDVFSNSVAETTFDLSEYSNLNALLEPSMELRHSLVAHAQYPLQSGQLQSFPPHEPSPAPIEPCHPLVTPAQYTLQPGHLYSFPPYEQSPAPMVTTVASGQFWNDPFHGFSHNSLSPLDHSTTERGRGHEHKTMAEWEKLRPEIEDLYVGQGKTAKAVLEILQERHSFITTFDAVKKRLKAWRLTKNTKREVARRVLRLVRRREASGKQRHKILVHGKEVVLKKIYRHERRTAKLRGQLDPPDAGADDMGIVVRTPSPDRSVIFSVRNGLKPPLDFGKGVVLVVTRVLVETDLHRTSSGFSGRRKMELMITKSFANTFEPMPCITRMLDLGHALIQPIPGEPSINYQEAVHIHVSTEDVSTLYPVGKIR